MERANHRSRHLPIHYHYQFTTTGLDDNRAAHIDCCKKCNTPLINNTCSHCKKFAPDTTPSNSLGVTALIYNTAIILVTSLIIYYCKNHMNDGEGFNSNFIGLILSIGTLFGAGSLLLIGNIAFIILALSTNNNK